MRGSARPWIGFEAIRAFLRALPAPDRVAIHAARARQDSLTKPTGALGRLEGIACFFAGWQGRPVPCLANPHILVFAGNHGVCAQGVNAYPQAVTAQMVANYRAGGAAINQLAQSAGAGLTAVPLALDRPTADFTQGPALSQADCLEAIALGAQAVDPGWDLLVLGEMGIGNSTVAAALAHALLGGRPEDWVGRGTGVDAAGLARKAAAVAAGVARLPDRDPLTVLCHLGGREQAAILGALLEARRHKIPVLLDGFICCAAALVAFALAPSALDHCLAGHRSAEAGHGRMLDATGLAPLLDLGLRLGEGTGAALAVQIVRAALACHAGMASFAEAGVDRAE